MLPRARRNRMPISKHSDNQTTGDPTDRPLTASDLKRMTRTPQVKVIRRALGLTQEEFAARYRIPLGTLRDLEQQRTEPDQPAKAYLRVIAAEPVAAAKALQLRPPDLILDCMPARARSATSPGGRGRVGAAAPTG